MLVPVNPHAEVDVKAFRKAVRSPGVALAAVQHVNHEVGAIQPLEQVHEIARAAEVPLLVDACAALGSLPATPHWDVLAGSAHKWGGPAGVGILAVRTGVRWRSPMPTDEAGRWAGLPGRARRRGRGDRPRGRPRRPWARRRCTGPACSRSCASACRTSPRTSSRSAGPDSAPHIICFTVLYADGEVLVTELDRAGFAVSSGSACTADTRRPSHVLAAMGAITHGNLRVSLPPDATEADVAGFLAALPAAIAAARASADRASS